jgi:diguanylate cyclase (GGDEF)-like protein
MFGLYDVVLILRVITAGTLPTLLNPFSADVWQSLLFLTTIVVPIGWTFGFFMMTNARLNLELGKAEIELREMAATDFLTGALNRRSFLELSQREYERARRNEQPMVLLMIDIDQFKEFNDAYGHPGGDAMLVAIVANCRANLRASDLFVRWGGEEFATLLPDTDQTGGLQVAEKLRRAVEELCIPIDGFQGRATISVGGALWMSKNENWEAVERRADSALYHAKQNGRNCVRMG